MQNLGKSERQTLSVEPRALAEAHAPYGRRPFAARIFGVGAYLGIFAVFSAAAGIAGPVLKEIGFFDFILLGLAVHRASWFFSRDEAGEFLRRYLRLPSSPFAIGPWLALFFVFALVFAPFITRISAAILATVFVSDVLHAAYLIVRTRLPQGN